MLIVSLGVAIGGDLLDDRFAAVLRAKVTVDETLGEKPFLEWFRTKSKPRRGRLERFADEAYPFYTSPGERFVLTKYVVASIFFY